MSKIEIKCQWCAKEHETVCPMVKSLEYFDTGAVKRVEFKSAIDYYVPLSASPLRVSPDPAPWIGPGLPWTVS